MKRRAGEIAAWLVEHEPDRAPSAGVLAHFERALAMMIEGDGPVNGAHAAAVAASALQRTDADSAPARTALAARLASIDVMRPLLTRSAANESARGEVLRVLSQLGPPGTLALATFMSEQIPSPKNADASWLARLERYLADEAPLDASSTARVVESEAISLSAAASALRRGPTEAMHATLAPMLDSDDPAHRRRAYALLDVLTPTWPGDHIRCALLDADPAVAALGRRRLAKDVSTRELCGLLRSLAMSITKREAVLARAVLEIIEQRSEDQDVRQALRAWRFSPGRLRVGLLPRERKEAA